MQSGKNTYDPIAVIGIGCRFPGGISNAESFWNVLANNKDVITEIPGNRLGDPNAITDPARTPGKIVINSGGFLENIDQFDATFFNISPREAEMMDPQQRLMLEIAFEAVENAGKKINSLSGTKTGVYVGQWTSDYENRVRKAAGDIDLYATLGTGRYASAGRISYAFNLRGPSMVIDTHCSSSLVSVHMACQAIRSGEIDYAIAGGVNAILDPFISVGYSRSGILSDYGRCRFGDENGNGYVRSEGAGVVVLKSLSAAERDGDVIHGIIRSSVVNNDGRTNKHMAAPSEDSQAEMLEEAYARSGIKTSEVHYIEAHGTGTKVGDPVEINALNRVLGQNRKGNKCIIGSVKTNLGHTEAAAGIAGLLKTLLILKHRTIPASLHLDQPNKNISWETIPFSITQENINLDHIEGNILAGVNSFGITGTNAHVVLEEYKAETIQSDRVDSAISTMIFPFSASTESSLNAYSRLYADQLSNLSEASSAHAFMADLCMRKSDLQLRKAVVADSLPDLIQKLTVTDDSEFTGIVEGQADLQKQQKIIFVFPGQGSQWPGMGRELFESEPVFKDEILAWEAAFSKLVDWSLTEELFNKAEDDTMSSIDIIQPALVAMEAALTRLWQSWGIQPDALLGHSMGEVAAAYIAGIMNINDAATVICNRSALMKTTSGKGAMGYIGLTPEEVSERIKGNEALLGVAVNNSPNSAVVSGDPAALDTLLEELTEEEVFCRKIKVDVASHSPQMDGIKDRLKTSVMEIKPIDGSIPFYSTVFQDLASGSDLDPEYWVKNLRQPVQFAKTIQKILQDGATFFLEMSPHPLLLQAIHENATHVGKPIASGGSLKRDEDGRTAFLESVGNAWCNGLSPDWERLYGKSLGQTSLPSYPWDREVFWVDESGVDATAQWQQKSAASADAQSGEEAIVSFRDKLKQLTAEQALDALESKVKELTGSVVRKKAGSIKSSMAFKTLGIDSLMAVQLKERIEKSLEVPISVTSFWTYATINEYVQFLMKSLGVKPDDQSKDKPSDADDISDEDISDLLASELMDL